MSEVNIVDRLENPEVPYSWDLRADAAEEIKKLHKQLDAKQARIDELMQEYCGNEVTKNEREEEWELEKKRIEGLDIFNN